MKYFSFSLDDLFALEFAFGHVDIFSGYHHAKELTGELIKAICKLEAADSYELKLVTRHIFLLTQIDVNVADR